MNAELDKRVQLAMGKVAEKAIEQSEYDPNKDSALEVFTDGADTVWESLTEEERRDVFVDTLAHFYFGMTVRCARSHVLGSLLKSLIAGMGEKSPEVKL